MSYPQASQGIMQPWTFDLPIRHQGTLIAAVRGCDGASRNSNVKPLVRFLRWTFLNPADHREVSRLNAFMASGLAADDVYIFLGDWDQYPMHFIQHLMHAYEVVGYKHPDSDLRRTCLNVYLEMVNKLHLSPETEVQMDERLTEDRIKLGKVEEFAP